MWTLSQLFIVMTSSLTIWLKNYFFCSVKRWKIICCKKSVFKSDMEKRLQWKYLKGAFSINNSVNTNMIEENYLAYEILVGFRLFYSENLKYLPLRRWWDWHLSWHMSFEKLSKLKYISFNICVSFIFMSAHSLVTCWGPKYLTFDRYVTYCEKLHEYIRK